MLKQVGKHCIGGEEHRGIFEANVKFDVPGRAKRKETKADAKKKKDGDKSGAPDEDDGDGELFYQFPEEYFWDDFLPALEEIWNDGGYDTQGDIRSFPYPRKEVQRVMSTFEDPYGPVMYRSPTGWFRRCVCRKPDGTRNVCIPPRAGWMCERPVMLVKMTITLERELQERQRIQNEKNTVIEASAAAEKSAKEFLETDEGKLMIRALADRRAHELQKDEAKNRFQGALELQFRRKRKKLEKGFKKKEAKLHKVRDEHQEELEKKKETLMEKGKDLVGWAAEQNDNAIDKGECFRIGAGAGIGFDAVAVVLAAEKRQTKSSCTPLTPARLLAVLPSPPSTVLDELANLPEDADLSKLVDKYEADIDKLVKDIEKKSKKGSLVEKIMPAKLLEFKNGLTKDHNEKLNELMVDLKSQYVDRESYRARKKVKEEHRKLKKIMTSWTGLGMRDTYREWKSWTKHRVKQRRRDIRKKNREDRFGYEQEMANKDFASWHLSKWVRNWDEFNDLPYWVHTESQETTYDEPMLSTYIPEGWVEPEPPACMRDDETGELLSPRSLRRKEADTPSEASEVGSSDESDEEWKEARGIGGDSSDSDEGNKESGEWPNYRMLEGGKASTFFC